jgi:hypothetical protein
MTTQAVLTEPVSEGSRQLHGFSQHIRGGNASRQNSLSKPKNPFLRIIDSVEHIYLSSQVESIGKCQRTKLQTCSRGTSMAEMVWHLDFLTDYGLGKTPKRTNGLRHSARA